MARPPDRLAFVVESVHQFPVFRSQPPYEPRGNPTQRHPVAVIPRSVIGDGIDEAVASVVHSTPVFAVLHEEGVAEDTSWEHRVAKPADPGPSNCSGDVWTTTWAGGTFSFHPRAYEASSSSRRRTGPPSQTSSNPQTGREGSASQV